MSDGDTPTTAQRKTDEALFSLGQKVHELEKGLEYWAAEIRAVGRELEEALEQERGENHGE